MRFLGSTLLLLEMKRNGTLVYQNTMILQTKILAILKQNIHAKSISNTCCNSERAKCKNVGLGLCLINSNHNSINPFTKKSTMDGAIVICDHCQKKRTYQENKR